MHAHAQSSRTKDTRPPCDGILRRLPPLMVQVLAVEVMVVLIVVEINADGTSASTVR